MPIRVLIAGLPPLVADVLASACERPPEFALADVVPETVAVDGPELELAIMTTSPDAVVVGVETDADRATLTTIQLRHCEAVIVGLNREGTQAWAAELHAELVPLDPVSPESIRTVIRRATGARA